jgi:hypothetical protein
VSATTLHAEATTLRLCPSCSQGHLQPAAGERVFHPHGQSVRVELLTSACEHCVAEAASCTQHQQKHAHCEGTRLTFRPVPGRAAWSLRSDSEWTTSFRRVRRPPCRKAAKPLHRRSLAESNVKTSPHRHFYKKSSHRTKNPAHR